MEKKDVRVCARSWKRDRAGIKSNYNEVDIRSGMYTSVTCGEKLKSSSWNGFVHPNCAVSLSLGSKSWNSEIWQETVLRFASSLSHYPVRKTWSDKDSNIATIAYQLAAHNFIAPCTDSLNLLSLGVVLGCLRADRSDKRYCRRLAAA